jgi:hypothetical protein
MAARTGHIATVLLMSGSEWSSVHISVDTV